MVGVASSSKAEQSFLKDPSLPIRRPEQGSEGSADYQGHRERTNRTTRVAPPTINADSMPCGN